MPVLVEKPMARSLAEADELIAAAARSRRRLSPSGTRSASIPPSTAARPLLVDPRFIEVHRLGTFPERSLDIDVVFDLMIHDLDVVLSLVDAEVESIEAVGVPVLTGRVDIANARLSFANGCIANLTASRISRDRVRKIRFFQPEAYLSIDYAAQKVEMWRLVTGDGPASVDAARGRPFEKSAPFDPAQGRPSIHGGELDVASEEPLKRELVDFVGAVTPPGRAPVGYRRGRPPRARRGAGRSRIR